jgi:hypothetical protein
MGQLVDRSGERRPMTDVGQKTPRPSAELALCDREADEFYRSCTPESASTDTANVMRQAFGGLFWTKQYYCFDVNVWLREHGVRPLHSSATLPIRNRHWFHMFNDDVISMPDKWENPWYAAWDLAFHTIGFAAVDPDFAKHQLSLMLKARYMHSNGQLPAYEWNFGDVNPPVHAWATLFQYRIEQAKRGRGDLEFLKRAFGKLLVNFTWWVGAGVGASHQTGWTALTAALAQIVGTVDDRAVPEADQQGTVGRYGFVDGAAGPADAAIGAP